MKLSKQTLQILKSFSNINPSLFFKEGNVLRTKSPLNNILAEVEIYEHIPMNFAIYDLSNFLSVLSLHKDEPEIDFDDKHVIIIGNNNRSRIKYRFCAESMIDIPTDKIPNLNDSEVSFLLNVEDFSWILKASSTLQAPYISVNSDGKMIRLVAKDIKNDASNTDSLDIIGGDGNTYDLIFKTEYIQKLILGTYDVTIKSSGISHFANRDMKLQYWMTLDKESKYN